MHLNTVQVKNFRCFDDVTWQFTPGFNILVGQEGSGKTALLEALRIAISGFIAEIEEIPLLLITNQDARWKNEQVSENRNDKSNLEFPVTITTKANFEYSKNHYYEMISGKIPSVSYSYAQSLCKVQSTWSTYKSNYKNMKDKIHIGSFHYIHGYIHSLKVARTDFDSGLAPLLFFCPICQGQNLSNTVNTFVFPANDFRHGYEGALDLTYNNAFFWGEVDKIKADSDSSFVWDTMQKAALSCLPEMISGDGGLLLASQLSESDARLLALVLDIARRVALLNPFLQEKALQETPGVVLVDDFAWDANVLEGLRRTFPLVQFVIAMPTPPSLVKLDPASDQIIDLEIVKKAVLGRRDQPKEKTVKEYAVYIADTPTLTGEEIRRLFGQFSQGAGAGTQEAMAALARHPSLPPDIACWLVTNQPEALAENPALPLLMIEKPNLFEDRPAKKLRQVLHRETVAPLLLQILSTHRDRQVREAAQYHVNFAGEAGTGWEEEARAVLIRLAPKNSKVLCELHSKELVPHWLVDALKLQQKPSEWMSASHLLSHYVESPQEILRFVSLSQVIGTPIFSKAVSSHNWVDRFAVAVNPNVAPERLEKLARDGNRFVRAAAQARQKDPNWRF
jgi:predicted ATP-binding protein involved in virulence